MLNKPKGGEEGRKERTSKWVGPELRTDGGDIVSSGTTKGISSFKPWPEQEVHCGKWGGGGRMRALSHSTLVILSKVREKEALNTANETEIEKKQYHQHAINLWIVRDKSEGYGVNDAMVRLNFQEMESEWGRTRVNRRSQGKRRKLFNLGGD